MMFVDGWSPTLIRVQTRRPAVIWKIGAYTTSRSLPMGLDQSPAATPIVASIRRPLRAVRAPGRSLQGHARVGRSRHVMPSTPRFPIY